MAIYTNVYLLLFLPLTLVLYHLTPQKHRWMILLGASYFMYCTLSGALVLVLMATTALTYGIGRLLEHLTARRDEALKTLKAQQKAGAAGTPAGTSAGTTVGTATGAPAGAAAGPGPSAADRKAALNACRKKWHKKRLAALLAGVLTLLGVLFYVQYYNFVAGNLNILLGRFSRKLPIVRVLFPMGISFYTLEAIGYMADVYWERLPAERHLGKLALFLSFFPQIMEGPIARYQDTADALYAGAPLTMDDLREGFLRILWGLFKKMVISDRLSYLINYMFGHYDKYHGSLVVLMAVGYTVQLYCEFSGSIDIVIGSGRLFGIALPENFRRPFSAQSAAEFWRRWHMSLGTWFKNYVFYPVTTSSFVKNTNKKLRKKYPVHGKYISMVAASAASLLPVWIATGVWHGAGWQYLFYGVYYYVILLLGVALEPFWAWLGARLHIPAEARWMRVLRTLKTWPVIFTGELFFNAKNLTAGFRMFRSIFRDFHISDIWLKLPGKITRAEIVMIIAGCIVVWTVGFLEECGIDVRRKILDARLPVRWAAFYALIFLILLFGTYGTGYQAVDLIYAGF